MKPFAITIIARGNAPQTHLQEALKRLSEDQHEILHASYVDENDDINLSVGTGAELQKLWNREIKLNQPKEVSPDELSKISKALEAQTSKIDQILKKVNQPQKEAKTPPAPQERPSTEGHPKDTSEKDDKS